MLLPEQSQGGVPGGVAAPAQPTRVGKAIEVVVPRPRDRTGPELNALRKELLVFLAEERRKARPAGDENVPLSPASDAARSGNIPTGSREK